MKLELHEWGFQKTYTSVDRGIREAASTLNASKSPYLPIVGEWTVGVGIAQPGQKPAIDVNEILVSTARCPLPMDAELKEVFGPSTWARENSN